MTRMGTITTMDMITRTTMGTAMAITGTRMGIMGIAMGRRGMMRRLPLGWR